MVATCSRRRVEVPWGEGVWGEICLVGGFDEKRSILG